MKDNASTERRPRRFPVAKGLSPALFTLAFILAFGWAAHGTDDGQHKTFSNLLAECEAGKVLLSFNISPGGHFESETTPVAVRIYRKRTDSFTFGKDYAEYFDELPRDDAELIYDDLRVPAHGRTLRYTDENVEIGAVYAYWVSGPEDALPAGPVPVKVRDPEVWWPKAEIDRRMQALASAFPNAVRLKTIGRTAKGEPLQALFIGKTQGSIALVGAVHAGESGPELTLPAAERLLREHRELVDTAGLAVLPVVNADERERQVRGCPWYLRKNATGVDLNRNFDAYWDQVDKGYGLLTSDPESATYRGACPLSTPEAAAVVDFIEAAEPSIVFSYHALACITGGTFLAPRVAKEDAAFSERVRPVLDAYTHGMYPEGGRDTRLSFGTSSGSLPTWLYLKKEIPAFDLEWDGNKESDACRFDRTTLELLSLYQDRHYGGILAVLERSADAR